ncbi:hypothetical protein J23TS9_52180 [Paenibacillus sp. J23TS9]|nr:hypothetical protein J23TS9_52180 [Paenibacillus sp. J23TS9]
MIGDQERGEAIEILEDHIGYIRYILSYTIIFRYTGQVSHLEYCAGDMGDGCTGRRLYANYPPS